MRAAPGKELPAGLGYGVETFMMAVSSEPDDEDMVLDVDEGPWTMAVAAMMVSMQANPSVSSHLLNARQEQKIKADGGLAALLDLLDLLGLEPPPPVQKAARKSRHDRVCLNILQQLRTLPPEDKVVEKVPTNHDY